MKLLLSANFSTQFVKHALQNVSDSGESFIWSEAEFGSVIQSLFSIDRRSDITALVILMDGKNLENQFHSLSTEDRKTFGIDEAELLSQAVDHALSCGIQHVFIGNIAATAGAVHGTHHPLNHDGFEHHRRQWNQVIYDYVTRTHAANILDLERLIVAIGIRNASDAKLRVLADQPWSLSFTEDVANFILRVIRSKQGALHKCLILDLDNTLWGGVIGDDGVEGIAIGQDGIGKAFRDVQLWARELKRRGVILCICSKNTESVAREPFAIHPEMILREDDIAVFVANWENKASNIQYIQEVLNISFDSMVFLDDNPMERSIVRENIPGITVPELPENPEEYLGFLQTQQLFETTAKAVVSETKDRNRQYQIEAKRLASQKSAVSLDDFLTGLEMKAIVSEFQPPDFPRIEELFQRSNQFNLTTYRYSSQEISQLAQSKNHCTWSFRLEDKFGHHGLISLVVGKIENECLIIEAWVMSCRVLKRTMEDFIFNSILETAQKLDLKELRGVYLPTAKNKLVEGLYPGLGFQASVDGFILETRLHKPRDTFILTK